MLDIGAAFETPQNLLTVNIDTVVVEHYVEASNPPWSIEFKP